MEKPFKIHIFLITEKKKGREKHTKQKNSTRLYVKRKGKRNKSRISFRFGADGFSFMPALFLFLVVDIKKRWTRGDLYGRR